MDDLYPTLKRRHTHEPVQPEPAARKKRIGFVGPAAGAGTTTLAFAAAEYLASSFKGSKAVTLLELDPRTAAAAGRPYDKIGIDRRFAGRDFTSFYRLVSEGKPLHNACNNDRGINWILRVPGEPCPGPASPALFRLLDNASGDIVICDIAAYAISDGETLLSLLADLTRVICVFDLLPSRLLASIPVAETCRTAAASGVPVTYVFNKLNPGVNLREATRFTGITDYIPFPAIPAETIYASEYACRSLASVPEIKSPLSQLLNPF